MAGNEIEELVLKVTASVDDKELKRMREDLRQMQTEAQKTASNLGINTGGTTKVGTAGGSFSQNILLSLKKSNELLAQIVLLLRGEKTASTSAQAQSGGGKLGKGVLSAAQGIASGNGIGAIGGAAVGGLFGAAAGAIASQLVGIITSALQSVKKGYEGILNEDLGFTKLARQTGQAKDSINKLDISLRQVGSSAEKAIANSQGLVDEMLTGGLSIEKATLLTGLGINPYDYLTQSLNNPLEAQKNLSKRLENSNLPATIKTSVFRTLGIDQDLRFAFANVDRPDVRENTERIFATQGRHRGSNETVNESISYFGQVAQEVAKFREKLTQPDQMRAAINAAFIEAKEVQITTSAVTIVTNALQNLTNVIPGAGLAKAAYDFLHNNENNASVKTVNPQ